MKVLAKVIITLIIFTMLGLGTGDYLVPEQPSFVVAATTCAANGNQSLSLTIQANKINKLYI